MKDLRDALNDIREARQMMEKLNDRLPDIIGVEALAVIDKNFDNESYDTGNGKIRWKERTPATNRAYDNRSGGLKGSVFNSGSKLLDQTGNLRSGIRKKREGRNVFIGVNLLKVPYAQIHNEGGSISIKARRQTLRFSQAGRFKAGRINRSKGEYWRRRTIGAHVIKMPKRQYMPMPGERPNGAILKRAKRKIDFEHARIMKKFRK